MMRVCNRMSHRIYGTLLCVGCLHTQAVSQPPSPAQPPVSSPSSPDSERLWVQDLDALVKQLPSAHPDLYARITKNSFQEEAKRLRSDLGGLNNSQRLVRMMELVALAGDSHTTLVPSTQAPFSMLPLGLRAFEDGVYVVGVGKSKEGLLGMRLVGIGGVPWEEASARLSRVRAAETTGWRSYMLCETAITWEILQGLGLAGAEPQVSLTLQDASGARKEVVFEAMLNGANTKFVNTSGTIKLPDYASRRNGLRNWMSMLSGKPVLYVRYNRCSDEPNQSVDAFCGKVVETIEGSTPQRIVLDLRGNTGGSSSLLNRLIRFFERRTDLKGKVFVAINGSTFSSGLINAHQLKKAGGILIGEPSGSLLNHLGDVRTFVLPSSKLQVSHSTRRFLLDRSYQDGEPLRVDIPVAEKASDWFAGRDLVLEHVISTLP